MAAIGWRTSAEDHPQPWRAAFDHHWADNATVFFGLRIRDEVLMTFLRALIASARSVDCDAGASGLVSRGVPLNEQGAVQGALSSLASLA
jgi:hypothetical protein